MFNVSANEAFYNITQLCYLQVLASDTISYCGQPVAIVVAG